MIHNQNNSSKRSGYALPAVLIISFILASLTASFLQRAESSSKHSAKVLERHQTFFATDGMSRIAIQQVQNYMDWNSDPSTEDLQNTDNIPVPAIPGYTIEEFNIYSTGAGFEGPLPNGPFEGVYARQKPVRMHITAKKDYTDTLSKVDLQVNLGQISMFQFFVFGDGYTELYPGPAMKIHPGRIHSNDDLCIGSYEVLEVESLTAASRILASDGRCRRTTGSGLYVWNNSNFTKIDTNSSNGCTNCNGTGQDWQAFALSRWQGNVKDSAHSVPHLKLPISGLPSTHAGLDANGDIALNTDTTRLLVDPVRSMDAEDIYTQKYAWKADIRILDGVWYINNGSYPGQAIWSDHPGSFTDPWGNQVGQSDLATSLSWEDTPQGYSYYAYDTSNAKLFGDTEGALSYGTLYHRSATRWKPGFWAAGSGDAPYTDGSGTLRNYMCSKCNGGNCSDSLSLRDTGVDWCQSELFGSYSALPGAQLLQGARGGFIDFRIAKGALLKGLMLPVNFDLETFAVSLQDNGSGELGTYFDSGSSFNGIIYISNSWDGSEDGLPDGIANLWPSQGGISDDNQSLSYGANMVQDALPKTLCSSTLGPTAHGGKVSFSGPISDGDSSNGYEPYFVIPDCEDSSTGTPNSVRILNADNIDPTVFPVGLSIVSNLPMYILGDTNTESLPMGSDLDPWIPVMFGADAVSLLSNAWDDDNAPWNASGSYSNRGASTTTYNMQILSGLVQTSDNSHYSGGVENFPRFLENWTNITAYINGSLVQGFASIYARQPWFGGSPIYDAPSREWAFDSHLMPLSLQPPGAPLYSVHSVSRLKRQ